jgi:hypothetical protein
MPRAELARNLAAPMPALRGARRRCLPVRLLQLLDKPTSCRSLRTRARRDATATGILKSRRSRGGGSHPSVSNSNKGRR